MMCRPFALPSWPRVASGCQVAVCQGFSACLAIWPVSRRKTARIAWRSGPFGSRFGLCRCLPCRGAGHWCATVGGCGSLRPCLFWRAACHAGVATRHRIAGFRLAASHGRGGWGLRCRSRFRFLLQPVLGLPECAFAQPHYFADVFLLFV